MYRTLRLVGIPYTLPPGTPRDRVIILQDANAQITLKKRRLFTYVSLILLASVAVDLAQSTTSTTIRINAGPAL